LYLAALITSAARNPKAEIMIKLPTLIGIFIPDFNATSIRIVLVKLVSIIPVKLARMYKPISIDSMGCFTELLLDAGSFRKLEKIVIKEPTMPMYCANCSTV
jgi:hypothetical protein